MVTKTQITIDKGDTYSTLPKKMNLGFSDTRYKLYIKYFGKNFPELKVGQYSIPAGTNLEGFFS
jgi:hypothetical protein